MRTMTILTALVLALLLATPPVTAEGPKNYACDGPAGLLVCAGAGTGAAVDCGEGLSAVANCTYTYGWIFDAFSFVGLPGEAQYEWNVSVTTCHSGGGIAFCSSVAHEDAADCMWVADGQCLVSVADGGSYGPVDLTLGECVTITVRVAAAATAWVPGGGLELARAEYSEDAETAGQVCHVDDGR